MWPSRALVTVFALMHAISTYGFQPTTGRSLRLTTTELAMGKGLNKFKNKQADLKRKMELAKQQKREASGESVDEVKDDKAAPKTLTDEQIKERNDRKRFEELLQREGAKVLNDYTSDDYLNSKQEEEEITAARKYCTGAGVMGCKIDATFSDGLLPS